MGWGGLETGRPGPCEGNQQGGLGAPLRKEQRCQMALEGAAERGRRDARLRAGESGCCSVQRNKRCKRRGALWRHSVLLPLAAGLGLDDHLLHPHLPHLHAALGTESLPGAFLHGQVVLDGGAGAGAEKQTFGNNQFSLGVLAGEGAGLEQLFEGE